jgi:hypothetical protein
VKCPYSTPIALEFLLTIFRDTGISRGSLLENSPQWVEGNSKPDGSLLNPEDLIKYPCADWQKDGHNIPVSIAGNLNKYDLASEKILNSARTWAAENLTLDKVASNDWLFMAYKPFDYYMNIENCDNIEKYQEATMVNINTCALGHEKKGELNKLFPLFQFVDGPNSEITDYLDINLLDRILDFLENSQRNDGGWDDEHGLKYWQPYFSTVILLALKRFGRV